MATTPINNTQPIRFEAGGTATFTDSAALDVEVNNREKGTLEVEQGGYEVLDYQNKGLNQIPLEGDQVMSRIRMRMKLTKKGTNDIMSLSQARDTTTGLVKVYTLVVRWLDHKNVATYTQHTFTNVFFTRPARIVEGTRFDTVEVEMMSTNPQSTYAAG